MPIASYEFRSRNGRFAKICDNREHFISSKICPYVEHHKRGSVSCLVISGFMIGVDDCKFITNKKFLMQLIKILRRNI